MSAKLQPVRGTHDTLPEESRKRRHLVDAARGLAQAYGFGEIDTPVFEFSEVFHRTLGETSDVVSKETYTFNDRGGESLTLRPELTAGIVRAFISNGLQEKLPCKFFYYGPAFRYERPQKGRLRQFHQIGVELLGLAEPLGDIEVVALGVDILQALGVWQDVRLEINTLGDAESRSRYRDSLAAYFAAHKNQLSPDSQARLERNPLRILDSKDEGDRVLIVTAPKLHEYLTPQSGDFFRRVQEGLATLGIPFYLNERLVRGLDYYCHTVFECTTTRLGAQGAVLAGGRYDRLVEMMGGPSTPGVGWAAGVERLLALAEEVAADRFPALPLPVALIPLGEAAEREALKMARQWRREGVRVEMDTRGNLGKRLGRADKLGARWAIILGEEELARGMVTMRDMRTGEQRQAAREQVTQIWGGHHE